MLCVSGGDGKKFAPRHVQLHLPADHLKEEIRADRLTYGPKVGRESGLCRRYKLPCLQFQKERPWEESRRGLVSRKVDV